MMLVPSTSIIVAYFAVALFNSEKKSCGDVTKIILWGALALVLIASLYSGFSFYAQSTAEARGYYPSAYNQQWQKAMAWTRTSTPESAVFGHWWDYGYWIQSIGNRATVLDGGNSIVYWNYMMGRYALTAPDDSKAIEYLYAHNTTHFLIDSSDIGKYTAFSSIGSDVNYDRRSWIPALGRDNTQTTELKNSTITIYTGGTSLDGDIVYQENGTKIFLPAGKAGLGAVILERNSSGALVSNPTGIFVYQNSQYRIPFRYAFDGKLIDFGSGLDAGVFLMPRLNNVQSSFQVETDGAMLYLSSRTVHSQIARLYLYNENNPYFKLAHSEDDFVVAQLKAQNSAIGDFVYYGGVRGPIKIWNINYPAGMSVKDEYLLTDYPDPALRRL
jgi:hypothetical protein